MDILIACEFSAIVRDAFRSRGANAYSCDLIPCEGNPKYHIQGDVLEVLNDGWDMMIAHPPCTYLAVSGNNSFRCNPDRWRGRLDAALFAYKLWCADINKIGMENPVGVLSSYIRQPDQIIQPWQFGHGETKKTCLWLKNLPKLKPTKIVEGREQRIWKMPPSEDRSKLRSITYKGIANAMAEQWLTSFSTRLKDAGQLTVKERHENHRLRHIVCFNNGRYRVVDPDSLGADMISICAWCGKDLGEKAPLDNKQETHGICAECAEDLKNEITLYKQEDKQNERNNIFWK